MAGRNQRWIEPEDLTLKIEQQCELLNLSESSYYCRLQPDPQENLRQMRRSDELCLRFSYYDVRPCTVVVSRELRLIKRGIRISMDGGGRVVDGVLIERSCCSLEREPNCPGDFLEGEDLPSGLSLYLDHCDQRRPHQAPA